MFWQHSQTKSTILRAKALYTSMKNLLIIVALVATSSWAQVPVHVPNSNLPRVPKAKLLRSNPHRLAAIRTQGTNPYDAPDDEFLCSSSVRRPKVSKPIFDLDEEPLSDYVTVRLAVARARAMEKYRSTVS